MCGIVGLALKKNAGFYKKDEDIFFDLLFANTLRGDDSTGVVFVEKDGSFGYMKDAYSAPMVIDDFKDDPLNKGMYQLGKAMIGHNRKATVGKVHKDTAHPFIVDKTFAMVHNGTLFGHNLLAKTTVDSEALAIHLKKVLGKNFDKETFEEAMGEVYGAYAVACYNQETHKIHLLRNAQRPLFIVETDEAWVWASEYGMLAWILGRHGINIGKDKAEQVKENCIYTIDLSENKLTKEDYVPKKAPPVTNNTLMVIGTQDTKTTGAGQSGTSKQEYKRLRKKLVFQTVTFWADDYVEKNFPKLKESGETELTLFGELLGSEFNFYHAVHADIDLKQHPSIQDKFTNKIYSGRIYEMEFDSKGGGIIVKLDRLCPLPSRNEGKLIDGKWIANKLDEKDKHETQAMLHRIH